MNPNGESADITLTAYNADGSLLAGVNAVERTIAANSQLPVLVSDLFTGSQDPATVGWIQATSTTDNLTGFFLFFNDTVPFNIFDGADLPQTGTTIVFPQVRVDNGYTTELNLINPSNGTASLTVQLIPTGSAPISQSLELPAMGAARMDLATFFGISDDPINASVAVSSDVAVAGFELVRSPTADLVGLNARPSETLTHLYFPQMAVLGGIQTTLGVVNNSAQAVILTISAFDEGGDLYVAETTENPVNVGLDPGESLVQDLEELFGFSGSTLLDGWLQVESSSPAVTGYLTYELPSLGAGATVTPNQAGQTRGIFSHIATIEGLFTGVAILNPGQLVANVLIVAVKKDGTVLGSTSVLLQPGERISEILGLEPPLGLIPEAAGQGDGYVFVSSDLPVYLTSLFGDDVLKVLSNIPPQQSPEGFDPAAGIPVIEIDPSLAIVQPAGAKSFQVVGEGQGAVWSVDGTPGGDSTVGTIDNQGNYTAPAQVPEDSRTVSVSATVGSQTAGASLDILEKETLFSSVSIVQSVVYLGSLANLYTAELSILGGSGSGAQPAAIDPAQGSTDSEIFTVPAGLVKASLAQFPNEEISKMISFTASDQQEYLLLAAKTSGKIIRLDPNTPGGDPTDVATGLDGPTALVLDKDSGDLVVAEQTQISTVDVAALNTGLAAQVLPTSSTLRPTESFPTAGGSGIVIDDCTGDIYIAYSAEDVVRRFDTDTEELEDLFTLSQPGQMQGLFRRNVSCPDGFQILVAETGADQLTLLTPSRLLKTAWIAANDPIEVIFLPSATDFLSTSGILYTESAAGGTQESHFSTEINANRTPGSYDPRPDNSPLDITPPPTMGTEPPGPPEPPAGPSGSATAQSASFLQMPPLLFLLMFVVAVFAVVVLSKKEED